MTEAMDFLETILQLHYIRSSRERQIRPNWTIDHAAKNILGNYGYQKDPKAGEHMSHITYDFELTVQ